MRSEKKRIIIWVFVLLLAAMACLAVFFVFANGKNGDIVTISRGGIVMYSVNVKTIAEPFEYEIKDENGEVLNTVYLSRDAVYIVYADCPDGLCVKQGKLGAVPIICLPNGVVVRYESDNADYDTIVW